MKVLVWGLDKDYRDNKEWIEKNYDVEGYYDSNESKIVMKKGIHKKDLQDRINEFDLILVAGDPPSIVGEIVDNYNVPIEKIRVLFYELLKDDEEEITFFGENSEDAVLLLLFEKLGLTMDKISYLEIGTNDPVRHNNSFLLSRLGARGVLVDPFPTVGELAKKVRQNDRFINCVVSDKSKGNVTFYACASSAFSSLNFEHHKQYEDKRLSNVREISVPMIGINELIDMCEVKPNVLLCDAEGEDEKIIRAIDYTKNQISVIMVETDHFDKGKESLYTFLKDKGYALFSRIKQNDIYYKKR